jgi:hypothetical protein
MFAERLPEIGDEMTIVNTNLKWYYSGGASNSNPSLSIGGAKSSIELSATAMNNLFDNVTGDEAAVGEDEYRLLYFQNVDTDVSGLLEPVVVWETSSPPSGIVMEFGIADAGKNSAETAIADVYTAPAGVTFGVYDAKLTGLDLPDAPYMQNEYVGVWFHRHVSASTGSYAGDGFAWRVEGDTL